MITKRGFLLAALVFSIALPGCSSIGKTVGDSSGVINPEPGKEKPEITILASTPDSDNFNNVFFSNYIDEFESKYGVKVNTLTIGGIGYTEGTGEEFNRELTAKLHLAEGPELIYCCDYRFMPLEAMVKQKVLIDVRKKIPNLNKVYDALLDNEMYYVPVGIVYGSKLLNKHVLEDLGIEDPEIDWNKKDYYSIRGKWLSKKPRFFTRYELCDEIGKYLENMKLLDETDTRAKVNTPEMVEAIRSSRSDIFSGRYKLNRDYTYINYYNMLFEPESEECKKDWTLIRSSEYEKDDLNSHGHGENLLRVMEVDETIKAENFVILPDFRDGEKILWSNGFMLNRNSRNKELACEFINGLLSNKVQMEMYKNGEEHYPVNKDIEEDIRTADAQVSLSEKTKDLKEYALKGIKSGSFKLNARTLGTKERWFFERVCQDIYKIVIADKDYNDEELSKELQGLEDKYNIWLNE